MSLEYVTTVPLKGLAIPFMGVLLEVAFELALQLAALLTLQLQLSISFTFTIALALSISVVLAAQLNIALGLQLPSLVLALSISLDIELALVLSIILELEALLDCDLVALGWFGPGSGLGAAVSQVVPPDGVWPDGTDAEDDIIAFVFAATIPGPYRPDQVASVSLVAPPAPPPAPANPPLPPAAPYPPPQAYTAGLARVVIEPPPAGGTPATASCSVDSSVATGIGAVTAVSLDVGGNGAGYATPPKVTIVDAAPIVSATTASPIEVTLPDALSIPVGNGFGCTVTGVTSTTPVQDATPTSPIVVTLPSTSGIVTVQILPGSYGMTGLNGTWFLRATSSITGELWQDKDFTLPSAGTGVYTGGATFAANINGLQHAKVTSPTTVELYQDADFLVPVVGVGAYSGGQLAGAGTGAVANATMGGGALQTMRLFFGGVPWPTVSGHLAGGATKLSIALGGVFPLIGDLLNELRGRASLLGGVSASIGVLPPSISATIDFLLNLQANLRANLDVEPPNLSASASVDANIEIVADLVARIGLFLGLDGDLLVYRYEGPGSGLGPAITSTVASGWHDGTPPSTPVVAGVFGLTNPAATEAFKVFFPVAA